MKILMTSAAIIALSGAAYAQDAYITQMGDNHSGVNYSEYHIQSSSNPNTTQVIAQSGEGFQAANLSRGTSNAAYTYQMDLTNDWLNNGVPSGTQMESLIFQKGDGFTNGNNAAVTVQLANQGPGVQNTNFMAQTIQEGNNNTAVNWAQSGGGALASVSLGSMSAPSLSLTPAANALPTPIANVNFPYGSNITIN